MDPLSILASSAAIFDALKAAYRFAEDYIKADAEREEFLQRLECVRTLKGTLEQCIAAEKDQPGHPWVKVLIPDDPKKSPLLGLRRTMDDMNVTLQLKETALKQKLKNFKWHSEKKSLDGFFTAIATYCTTILGILSSANIGISRDTNTIVRGIVVSLEQGWEEQKKLQEERRARQEEKRKYQEQKMKHREEERQRQEEERRLREQERQAQQEERKRWEEEQRKAEEESDRKNIQPWLSPLDFQARQRAIFAQSYRTGEWFLRLAAFGHWKQGEINVLRCHGGSGAGKTVLSSIVVDHLVQNLPSNIPVLCMFLEKTSMIPHTPDFLIGSLLRQLVRFKNPAISPAIRNAYKEHSDAEPSRQDLLTLLKAEIETYERIYVVVDGLDEASEESRFFVERELRPLLSGRLRLMSTARRDVDPSDEFLKCDVCGGEYVVYQRCIDCSQASDIPFDLCSTCLKNTKSCPRDAAHRFKAVVPDVFEVPIYTPAEDLKTFVRSFIESKMPVERSENDLSSFHRLSPSLGWECYHDKALFDTIVDAVVECSKGRFLLAKLYTNSLNCQPSLRDIEDAVTEMQEHRRSLSETTIDVLYEKDMKERIMGQEPANIKFALQVLSVISCARRNLKLEELQHALATRIGDTKHYPKGIRRRENILHVTKGLVSIETDSEKTVRLDHLTLAEYLHKTREKWFPNGEVDMANICLSYLSFDAFSKPCTVEEFAAKEVSHSFISYAVQFWGDHVCKAGPMVHDAAIRYLKDPSRVEAYIQCAWAADTKHYNKWDVRRTVHPLHICAWFNLKDLISALDYKTFDLNVREGTYGQTPLIYACRRGNIEATIRLLELGANANIQSGKGRTALFEAVLRVKDDTSLEELENSVVIINALLELAHPGNEVDVNMPNPKLSNRTAVMMAIYRKLPELALPILRHPKIEINQQDSGGYTALSLAAFVGLTDIVKEMLEFDEIIVDVVEHSASRTALMFAAERNHQKIVELLLRRGAKPNLQNSSGATAMLRAVEEGSTDVVRVMINPQWEVNLFTLDEDNRTLLHGAAENGQTEILEILHEKGLQVDARDMIGMTPFHAACKSGTLEAARYLLKIGADSSIKDKYGRTPFTVAFQYGQTELMDLCKTEGTNSLADSAQNTRPEDLPVWSLVILRRMDLLAEAISRGAALDIKEPGTNNPLLHCAILENGNDSDGSVNRLDILRELLTAGKMSPNVRDKYNQTPLHIASLGGFIEVAEILLEHKAQLEEVDRFGRTPLMIAAKLENFSIALALINARAKINASKVDIDKLLLAAIGLRNTKAMEKLLTAKADRLAQDEYGRTTDLIARQVGGTELLKILQGTRSFVFPTRKVDTKTSIGVAEVEVFDEEDARQTSFTPFRSPALDREDEDTVLLLSEYDLGTA